MSHTANRRLILGGGAAALAALAILALGGLFALPEEDKYVELTQRPLFMENRKPGREPRI